MSYRTILVPTDFSDHAATAADLALAIADRDGATLALFHINELPDFSLLAVEPMYIPAKAWERLSAQHNEQIDAQFASLREQLRARGTGRAKLDTDYRRTAVVDGIIEVTRERSAELIVLGSAGASGPVEFLFGSVASKVARRAPCPVVLTQPGHATQVAERGVPRRALVAVDYSKFSIPVAEAAARLVGDGGMLDVVHVWREPAAFAVERGMQLQPSGGEFAAALEKAREVQIDRMGALLERADLGGCKVNSYVDTGSPPRTILRMADELDAELIAIGSHGREGAEIVLGTTADRIVRGAEVPVLIVPETAL